MRDNHIIRVIIQGYNRLSGPLQQAAQQGSAAMEKLRNKSRQYQQQQNETNTSVNNLSTSVDALNKTLEGQAGRVERLNNAWGRLRQNINRRLGRIEIEAPEVESPEELFERLRREGQAPRGAGGAFRSKESFVAEETARRAALQQTTQAIRDQADAVDDLSRKNKAFEGLPFDEIKRGFQAGRAFKFEDDDELEGIVARQKRLNQEALAAFDARRARERQAIEEDTAKNRKAKEEELAELDRLERGRIARAEAARDRFINQTKASLRQFRISREFERDDAIEEDRVIARTTSKKLVEERKQARARIALAKAAAAADISEQERITEEVISTRQRRFQSFQSGVIRKIRDAERTEIQGINNVHRERIRKHDERVRLERIDLIATQRAQLADVPNLVQSQREERSRAIALLPTGFERGVARGTVAVRDFFRGIRGARQGLQEFEGPALKAQSTFAQVGAQVGKATKSINSFVSVRWAAVISLVGVLGTVLINLAAALVAVASSAIMAAAALGGALLAGVAQAIPVVGLLAAAFNRLEGAMEVVEQREQAREQAADTANERAKERARSVQQLADAHYNLKRALEGVTDAQDGITDAHEAVTRAQQEQRSALAGLAQARQEAARAIVDASLEERDARLSLQEAELGVLSAKQRLADFENRRARQAAGLDEAQSALREAQDRLKLAQQQGDAVEIASAAASVAAARGNVSALQDQIAEAGDQRKELELGVKRAEINEEQARRRRQRAIEEARTRRQQGIEGSPEVTAAQQRIIDANEAVENSIEGVADAQRALRDSQHSVVLAHRQVRDAALEVAEASSTMTDAQKKAEEAYKRLSPAQRRFADAVTGFKDIVKKNLDPITDIIIDAFARCINRAGILLQDPQIKKGLTNLATQIADVADRFSKWAISPEGRRTILFFINEAARNLPIIADAAGKFGRVLIRIAEAAAPLFRGLVDGLDDLGTKAENATDKTSTLEDFFASAGKHLKGWIDLAGAVGNLLAALVSAAAGEGLKMVGSMSDTFNELAERIRKNPKAIRDFFERVREGLGELLPVLGRFGLILLDIFTSKNMQDFTSFILLSVIPAVLHVIQVLGFVVGVLGDLVNFLDEFLFFGQPVISTLGKWVIGFGLVFGILQKIFPFLKVVNPLLEKFALAIWGVTKAMFAFLVANPWVAAIAIIILAIIYLERRFHFLGPTIRFIGRLFERIFNWIKDHWKLLVGILLGPLSLVVLGVIKWRDKIVGFFRAVIDWVRDHWKILLVLLTGPFGLVVLAVIKWKDKIIGFFQGIINWVRNNWKKLVTLILAIFTPGGLILAGIRLFKDKVITIFEGIKDGIINAFKKAFNWVRGKFGDLAGWLGKKAKSIPVIGRFFGGDDDDDKSAKPGTDTSPKAILNEDIQRGWHPALIKRLRAKGITDKDILATLIDRGLLTEKQVKSLMGFATGGQVPGGEGKAVPIIAHAGEWVLNKAQQMKLAKKVGESTEALKLYLFGGAGKSPQKSAASGRPTTQSGPRTTFRNGVELVPHDDDYGITLWWLKLANGEYAQVTSRDAKKIQSSQGTWFPGYIKNKSGGPFMNLMKNIYSSAGSIGMQKMASGGVVSFASPSVQSFASGGVVEGPVYTGPSQGGNTVNQEFNVKTEGATDWHHVMEIGAQKAQAAY